MTLTFSNLALLHFCHSSIEFEGHLNRIVKPSINGAVEYLKCISDQPLTFQHKEESLIEQTLGSDESSVGSLHGLKTMFK